MIPVAAHKVNKQKEVINGTVTVWLIIVVVIVWYIIVDCVTEELQIFKDDKFVISCSKLYLMLQSLFI